MLKLDTKQPYSYYKEKLQEIHDRIKEHPFRIQFQNEFQEGTFKSLYKEYTNLIYDATEVISYMCYYCSDSPLNKKRDDFWIHDFRSFLLTAKFWFTKRFNDDYYEEIAEGLTITKREILEKTGVTDINVVMIWLEKFITNIHVFLQTGCFERINGVEFEHTTKPHNGWYYKHLVEFEREGDGWKWVHEPEWINGERPGFVNIKQWLGE